jgi:hypothetical protein
MPTYRTFKQHLDPSHKPKRILALDGGGIRGVLTAGLLRRMEEILRARVGGDPNFRLSDYFDLIGGTSTGSIIAAGLSLGMTAEEVRNHYFTLGNATFKRDLLRIGAIRQKYDADNVVEALKALFKDRTLASSDFKTGLMVMSKRLDTGSQWPLSNNPAAPTVRWTFPTAGNYSNSFFRSGVILTQSNVGTFTLATGTNLAPEIILQTPSQIVQPGTSGRTLGINTVLGFDIAYRWRLNGANLPGATTNFILLNNIQTPNLGDYTCVLSNVLGVVTSEVGAVPTLVFDEVDAGVGGATAAAVGERLARLGARVQVLAVTHAPQVAAIANEHMLIAKESMSGPEGESMATRVLLLDGERRREEIARMLAGQTITDEARAAAERLLRENTAVS